MASQMTRITSDLFQAQEGRRASPSDDSRDYRANVLAEALTL
jgi:hypothetical protein